MKQNGQEFLYVITMHFIMITVVFFVYFYTKIYILEEWTSFHKLKHKKRKKHVTCITVFNQMCGFE